MLKEDVWVNELFNLSAKEHALDKTVLSPSENILRAAYRLHIPCLCRHTTERNRMVNCVASPTCFAGFQDLSTDIAAIEDCVTDIMGEGALVLPLPEDHGTLGDATKTLMMVNTTSSSSEALLLGRGIHNLGNTCYFNVVLQLLFNISCVRHDVLSAYARASSVEVHHVCDITDEGGEDTQDSAKTRAQSEDVCLVDRELEASGLGELFAEMTLSCDGNGANARPFASFLSLDTKTQQDAQEFFVLLIGWLQRSGCMAVKKTFEGTLLYDRRCDRCNKVFKRAETFFFLSLPVKSTVEEALSTFLSPEQVEGFTCDGCGVTTTASSRQYIRTLPDVFVVHLNRFSFDLQTLQRKKVTRTVSFPLEWDLTAYVNQWQQRDEVVSPTATSLSSEALYTLVGVVNHLGETAVSGHYTYYGKMDGNAGWYSFDDAEVTRLQHRFQGTRGSSKEAYMLVYQRCACKRTNDMDLMDTDVVRVPDENTDVDKLASVVLPPRLMKHVQRLNHELATVRKTWELRRAEVVSFMQQWADLARELFDRPSYKTTEDLGDEWNTNNLENIFAFPSSWLKLFGRCFLPLYVDVKRYSDGGKRKKRLRNSETSNIKRNDPFEFSGPLTDGTDENAPDPMVFLEQTSRDMSDRGQGKIGNMLFEGITRAEFLNHMDSLRCPHGKLSPWGPYKLLPFTIAMKVASLLKSIFSSSACFAMEDEACTIFAGWRVSEHTCDDCTWTMATEVLRLKNSWDGEKTALTMLRDSYELTNLSGICNKDSDIDNIIINGNEKAYKEEKVYVSESILEYWENSVNEKKKLKDVVSSQGFTGLFVVSLMKPICSDDIFDSSFSNICTPLCDHHLLSTTAAVRIIPVALWRYLREQVLVPLCRENNSSEYLEQLLPYLPAENTSRCSHCIQMTISTTTKRHNAALAKIDEGKRLSTVAAAGRIITAPQTEVQAQHPNRPIWKRNVEYYYREYQRAWEKEQAGVISTIEEEIAALKKKEEEEKKAHAAWESMRVRRGKHRIHNRTRGSAVAQISTQPTFSSAVATSLQEAEESLAAARTAMCPELRHVYGCVPMWWVVQWWRWYTDVDGIAPSPSCLDYNAFRCPHGGTLFAPHLLNPADSLWEKKSVASHLMQVWWNQHTVDTNCTDVTILDDSNLLGFPPLLLVPLKEFIDILETYGQCDMLFSSTSDNTKEDAVCRVNVLKTVLFIERNAERVFDPPSCDTCVAALLDKAKQASLYFTNGSLKLQLHLRCSKKNFYDAKDILYDVHHTTTLRELKQAISHIVGEKHGFMLPLEEMELLRGRKTLCRSFPRTHDKKQIKSLSSVTSLPVIDIDKGLLSVSSPTNEDECTLFDCGVVNGDVLTVNATEHVLLKIIPVTQEIEKWEDIPVELLQATQESLTTFASTRLYGAIEKNSSHTNGNKNTIQIACDVCTFLNMPDRLQCEMCETPLRQSL